MDRITVIIHRQRESKNEMKMSFRFILVVFMQMWLCSYFPGIWDQMGANILSSKRERNPIFGIISALQTGYIQGM